MAALLARQQTVAALLQLGFAFRLAAMMLDRKRPGLVAALEALRQERELALAAQQEESAGERQRIGVRVVIQPRTGGSDGGAGVRKQCSAFRRAAVAVSGFAGGSHVRQRIARRPRYPRPRLLIPQIAGA